MYDASWATVSNTPLKHYKQTQHEGGISSPLIVHWPGKIKNPGGLETGQGHLVDIMATCLEVAGIPYPETDSIQPLVGKSLLPLFRGEGREGHAELYFVFNNCRALRRGDWKVVSFYGNPWELYKIREDRFDQSDLAAEYPGWGEELATRWQEMAETFSDCSTLLVNGVGATPTQVLSSSGIRVMEIEGLIDEAIDAVFAGKSLNHLAKRSLTACGASCEGNGMGCG